MKELNDSYKKLDHNQNLVKPKEILLMQILKDSFLQIKI